MFVSHVHLTPVRSEKQNRRMCGLMQCATAEYGANNRVQKSRNWPQLLTVLGIRECETKISFLSSRGRRRKTFTCKTVAHWDVGLAFTCPGSAQQNTRTTCTEGRNTFSQATPRLPWCRQDGTHIQPTHSGRNNHCAMCNATLFQGRPSLLQAPSDEASERGLDVL